MNIRRLLPLFAAAMVLLVSCRSIEQKAVRSVADMLSSPDGAGAFTADDDPQLISDALPLALKLYEILLGMDPENDALAIATGKNFIMYSGAFVQMPAEMLEDEEWEEAEKARKRAKKLFMRGRDYILDGLEMRHEGFNETLEAGDYDAAMAMLNTDDVDAVYWAGTSWLGMASTDPFDMSLATTLDKAALLLHRALELDPSVPGIHDMMIQVQVSLPSAVIVTMRERSPAAKVFMDAFYREAGVGEDPRNRAFYHYEKALELSEGTELSPHLTMASAIAVKEQDVDAFRGYLEKVLDADPEANPDTMLMTVLYQDKARWLLDNMELFFLVDF